MASAQETREEYRRRGAGLRRELVEKMSTLASAALGLVAALAWNNAVQAAFKRVYPAPDDPGAIAPLFGYAAIVSVIAVLMMLWLGRVAARLKQQAPAPTAR